MKREKDWEKVAAELELAAATVRLWRWEEPSVRERSDVAATVGQLSRAVDPYLADEEG